MLIPLFKKGRSGTPSPRQGVPGEQGYLHPGHDGDILSPLGRTGPGGGGEGLDWIGSVSHDILVIMNPCNDPADHSLLPLLLKF